MSEFVKELISKMTFAEKVGQLTQLSGDFFVGDNAAITGPLQQENLSSADLYRVGSVLGVSGFEQVKKIQTNYLRKSRLKIPLLFMADVVHGYRTIFPIPLALAASFDPQLVRQVSEFFSREAAAGGIHVTFAPMVDLVRDPRWGRVMEANGEDPFLNSQLAKASVEGIQGQQKIPDAEHVAACVKHFAGYGAVEAGREYNTVDVSEWRLRDQYLSGYQAAIDAGAPLVMTAFNTFQGQPATGNYHLMRDILRRELGFQGLLISDWDAIGEMVAHGTAADLQDAAQQALKAGVDIDMMSMAYLKLTAQKNPSSKLVKLIDQAAERILNFKESLGLFTDPFRGLAQRAEKQNLTTKNLQLAQQAAVESAVLLKNKNDLLPLAKDCKIGLVGNYANNPDLLGSWSWQGKTAETPTIKSALQAKFTRVSSVQNQQLQTADLQLLKQQDVIVACLGLSAQQSGEATSMTHPQLPEEQLALLRQLQQLNKPVITVLITGRPLVLDPLVKSSSGLLLLWFPGSRGAAALTQILLGEEEPGGRLPMTFPQDLGQIPLYYNHYRTGRPLTGDQSDLENKYLSKYIDQVNQPAFCFGYGLGFAKTTLHESKLDKKTYQASDTIKVVVKIENHSDIAAKQVIQVYSQQVVGETVRPLWELKAFQKVKLQAKEIREVEISLPLSRLAYIHRDLKSRLDPGNYRLKVGFDSQSGLIQSFKII
ncbi:glycoside hydrolase family 3 N-terminal domain-containing protein [Liquorilactobacillus vini]|uniref:beta-glucosidase n=1 Tax=Liquorilactobacillus vini DSM 20605 TaxID=1133569 RepID=A0A0R2CAN8_9LACO|nr:glycoside hydrolase family 3 N-terminal domain-containing protein [Liquorilactobacillus vini]KRM88861.1 beta-glucosidase [Liquorilactobacillus vini DSM 20605]